MSNLVFSSVFFVKKIKFSDHYSIFAEILSVPMKNRILYVSVAVLLLTSCRSKLAIGDIQTQKNISIDSSMPDDGNADMLIAPYKKSLESQMNARISHTDVDLNKQGDNSNLGNLLADYTFDAAEEWAEKNNQPTIDAAVINIGGIRSTIGKGDILLHHIYEVMPFENELVIVKMKGKDLDGLFQYYADNEVNNPVSKLVIETEQGNISRALINGTPVNASKDYYIATSDYLALGGDNMKFFSKGELISTGEKLRDLYIEEFKKHPEITAPDDVRLIFRGKKERK